MADLSLPPRPDSRGDQSRGQIILIAAFALAVAFVALALVTNSAIFAENLASRGETSGAADAAAYQYEVRQDIGAAMEYANRNNNSKPSIALVNSVGNQSGKLADQRAVNSRVTSVDVTDQTEGTIIRQTADRNFTNDTGEEPWSLAKDVGRTRAFYMTITDHEELETTSGSDPFTVHVEDHEATNDTNWEMTLAKDDTGSVDDVVLEIDSPTVSGSETCRVSDVNGPVTVDVTGARLNGTYCGPLEYYDGEPTHYAAGISSQYNISYEKGGKINGTYSLVVNDSPLGTAANYDDATEMQIADAVYAAKVDLQYRTESLTYVSTIRVAPGEPE